MARLWGQDVRDKIIDVLKNGWTKNGVPIDNLDDTLDTIDTTRTQTTPDVGTITYDWGEFQYPILRVILKDSDIIQKAGEDGMLTTDIDLTPESFIVDILIEIQAAETELENYIENYIQGVMTVLNGYMGDSIAWILAISTDRGDTYPDGDQSFKGGLVQFQVKIN